MDIQFNAGNTASSLDLGNVRECDFVFTADTLEDLQAEVVEGPPEKVDKVFDVGTEYPIQVESGATWRYAYVLPRDEVQRDIALKWLRGEGALQVLDSGDWVDTDTPKWNAGSIYRIKPPAATPKFRLGEVVRIINQSHITGMVTAITNDRCNVGGTWYDYAELESTGMVTAITSVKHSTGETLYDCTELESTDHE